MSWRGVCAAIQKHPHVRGEDLHKRAAALAEEETPPRAWGRPSVRSMILVRSRNTPTCVGKTDARGWH